MRATRFCSACGERMKGDQSRSLPFRRTCLRCGARLDHVLLKTLLIPLLCLAIGFAIGNYSKSREPFQYIGDAIEPSADAALPAVTVAPAPGHGDGVARSETAVNVSKTDDAICGARTKSGRPCQRRVKGGGRCWQHRGR
jgi:hypothetical protein